MEQRLCEWPAPEGAPRAISRLEGQIEEQVPIYELWNSLNFALLIQGSMLKVLK